jgi:hypothetical protein
MAKKYRCDKTIDLEDWLETKETQEMTDEELANFNKQMRETIAQMRLLLKTQSSWNRTKH